MEFQICHLWPDALNANGSQGNVLCLRRRMEWRGHTVRVSPVAVGEDVDFNDFDLVYLGAGKLENEALQGAAALCAPALRVYAASGGAILAVCEGLELLGERIVDAEGGERAGMDVAPLGVCYGKTRLTGNLLFRYGETTVAAFENHAGRILLKGGAEPLGHVLKGHGNNELDDTVGVREGALFGCSAFGPLLPRNPTLADDILAAALARRHPGATLAPLDDALEDLARGELEKRLS